MFIFFLIRREDIVIETRVRSSEPTLVNNSATNAAVSSFGADTLTYTHTQRGLGVVVALCVRERKKVDQNKRGSSQRRDLRCNLLIPALFPISFLVLKLYILALLSIHVRYGAHSPRRCIAVRAN